MPESELLPFPPFSPEARSKMARFRIDSPCSILDFGQQTVSVGGASSACSAWTGWEGRLCSSLMNSSITAARTGTQDAPAHVINGPGCLRALPDESPGDNGYHLTPNFTTERLAYTPDPGEAAAIWLDRAGGHDTASQTLGPAGRFPSRLDLEFRFSFAPRLPSMTSPAPLKGRPGGEVMKAWFP